MSYIEKLTNSSLLGPILWVAAIGVLLFGAKLAWESWQLQNTLLEVLEQQRTQAEENLREEVARGELIEERMNVIIDRQREIIGRIQAEIESNKKQVKAIKAQNRAIADQLERDLESTEGLVDDELAEEAEAALTAVGGGSPEITYGADNVYRANHDAVFNALRAAIEATSLREAAQTTREQINVLESQLRLKDGQLEAWAERAEAGERIEAALRDQIAAWNSHQAVMQNQINTLVDEVRRGNPLVDFFTHPVTLIATTGVVIGVVAASR